MADYEIFREQLAIKYPSYGHALWEPRPRNPNRPVQVGDVGFVRKGRFHRLFSALLPADDPSQELGVPEYHEPLIPTLSNHVDTAPLSRNDYCSAGVKVEPDPGYHSSPDDLSQVLFQNETTRAAAVLSLPVMARSEDTLIRNVFGRWMVKHINTWFAFARSLGLVHQMEEIILVTGCDLTRSWTNIAFLGGRADAQVSFGVEVEGSTSNPRINFQFSPGRVRGAVLRHGPEGTNLPENQCTFIRGFRVAPSKWGLPKRFKAAAGPSLDPGYDRDPDMEVISIPAVTQFRDPLHLLSDYIAEQAPDCDKILVHDDDLLMIDGIGHGTLPETLEPEVMVDLLRKSDIKIHKFGCDSSLAECQSGSNPDTSNVKVATLSMTFQDWNHWPPLADQKVDLSHTSELRETPQPTSPGNLSALTFQTMSTKCKFSCIPEHNVSAPSTLQDLCDCVPLDRGQSAGCRHSYHEVSSGTRDPCDSGSYMNTTGAESGPGFRSTHYSKSAGGHGQDVDLTVAPQAVYSNATSRGPSFDPSSNLVDHVDASRVFETWRPGHDTGNFYSCPVCHTVSHRQDRKRHMLLHLPYLFQRPSGGCAWRGDSWMNLLWHNRRNHPYSIQEVDRNEAMIYDPWPPVEGIKDETTLRDATQQAFFLWDLWKGRPVQHFGIKTAFLHGVLPESETFFMGQPQSFEEQGKEDSVWHLMRSLYGMKQASRIWNLASYKTMVQLGSPRLVDVWCVYRRHRIPTGTTTFAMHVDDIITISSSPNKNDMIKAQLKSHWDISDLIAAISCDRTAHIIHLSQTAPIDLIVEQFGQTDAHPVDNLVVHGLQIERPDSTTPVTSDDTSSTDRTPYRSRVGSLNYLAVATHPDIAFDVGWLATVLDCYLPEHWDAAVCVVRYLEGTRLSSLERSGTNPIRPIAFTDPDYANGSDTSHKVLFLRQFPDSHDVPVLKATYIYCDNDVVRQLTDHEDQRWHAEIKHFRICHHFTRRDLVDNDELKVHSSENVADILTEHPRWYLKRLKFVGPRVRSATPVYKSVPTKNFQIKTGSGPLLV